MSWNRENVIWQSENGTWSRGFFESYYCGDEDGDPEWDVDYNYDTFETVSTGHATMEAARESWDGANPGGYSAYPFSADTREQAARWDAMAKSLTDYLAARREADRVASRQRAENLAMQRRLTAGRGPFFV